MEAAGEPERVPADADLDDRLLWVGPDDRGIVLEVMAVDLPDFCWSSTPCRSRSGGADDHETPLRPRRPAGRRPRAGGPPRQPRSAHHPGLRRCRGRRRPREAGPRTTVIVRGGSPVAAGHLPPTV